MIKKKKATSKKKDSIFGDIKCRMCNELVGTLAFCSPRQRAVVESTMEYSGYTQICPKCIWECPVCEGPVKSWGSL